MTLSFCSCGPVRGPAIMARPMDMPVEWRRGTVLVELIDMLRKKGKAGDVCV